MVKESQGFLAQINENYNHFRYNHVAQSVLYFISNKVSGLYCHCIKDRLYCSPKSSKERLSAQLTVNTIFVSLCKALGPILPHLIEEAWQHHPLYENPFYFTENLPILTSEKLDDNLMESVLDLKRDICVIAKNENLKKFTAKIKLLPNLHEKLQLINSQDGVNDSVLCEILELSSVSLEIKDGGDWEIELCESGNGQCLRCRKYNAVENSDKCLRCEQAIALL